MKIFILGSGVMGSGIGQVFAMAGHEVTLYDVREDALKKGMESIGWSLGKLASKGVNPDEVMKRISTTTNLQEAKGSSTIIEAVYEDLKVKGDALRAVSALEKDAVIGSNTSSLPITELSRYVVIPERFLGTHFFNPPVLMKLVEVIKGDLTSEETFNHTVSLMNSLGKYPLPVRKDVFGFVVNRILFRLFTSACSLLERYSPQEVDYVAMRELGMPMGLFMLLDYTGLDVNYYITKEAERRGFPFRCSVLEAMVKAGKLGRKSNLGFYDWSKGRPEITANAGPDPRELLRDALAEVKWLEDNGVASRDEIETGVKLGLGIREGLVYLGRKFNIEV
ncbi:3-hydroxyacyl-CoA dehydrogenase family protein [Metallosphaera tengchongensis]|uniref:3-hydroxyacyl-CoA dehydrogenase family protein n=1 Tax=Metallosphaera tengchongensis TaxID=1532350 RepID=A0A6N0NTW4_9CREN|nr:3-hydroxyacyl-CoA dehydrogenase family protein [Metallosphaera tengchongensis]QKR00216.1 3-hydroxyacyl-CoA dehydrogenase family protein [Metallosphaera tengchongensis]